MASIVAVCLSDRKGVKKQEVPSIMVRRGEGVAGDAHGDDPVRRISLLGTESVDKLRSIISDLKPGVFKCA